MITFTLCLLALIVGYFTYGRLMERIFGPDDRKTPALTRADGVDYIPLPTWKIFMIQFLNIAGLGPIFGAIMGAKFGTSTTVQHRVSTTVTTYLDSDELQDVIVNFGDDIIIKNEMDSVGFTYCGRRGEYRCPIYEPALNPKYNSGYYKLGIIPLAQY